MLSRRLVIASLILIPTLASAQRKTRGEKEANWDALDKENKSNKSGLTLSNKDVENMSPVKLLVEKKKDLKLTDEQVKVLKAQDEKLKEANKPLFKVLDSIRVLMRPTPNPNDDDRARGLSARLSLGGLMHDFDAAYKAATADALAALDDSQKAKANELLAEQATETEAMVKEAIGARGGGGRGGK